MSISFSGAGYSGDQYVGLESKTSVGTWSKDTWHPPLEAKTVAEICVAKWVPVGGEGGVGPPPILYSHAMNKGRFPDKMEFIKPTIDTYICSGESVPLEVQVWDQNGQLISGYTIEWTINQTGTHFSISEDSGYTATLTSADNTPGGESCTVTAKIKDTDITATSKKVTVVEVEFFKKGTTVVIDEAHVGTDGDAGVIKEGETSRFDVKVLPDNLVVNFSLSNTERVFLRPVVLG